MALENEIETIPTPLNEFSRGFKEGFFHPTDKLIFGVNISDPNTQIERYGQITGKVSFGVASVATFFGISYLI